MAIQKVGEQWEYLFISGCWWGRGVSEAAAFAAARKAGCPKTRSGFKPRPHSLYLVPKGAWIDGMGDIRWEGYGDARPILLKEVPKPKA